MVITLKRYSLFGCCLKLRFHWLIQSLLKYQGFPTCFAESSLPHCHYLHSDSSDSLGAFLFSTLLKSYSIHRQWCFMVMTIEWMMNFFPTSFTVKEGEKIQATDVLKVQKECFDSWRTTQKKLALLMIDYCYLGNYSQLKQFIYEPRTEYSSYLQASDQHPDRYLKVCISIAVYHYYYWRTL